MPLVLLALLSCRHDAGGDSGSACTAPAVTLVFPAQGQDPVSRSAPLVLQVEGDTALVGIEVLAGGQAQAGTTTVEDGLLRWTPGDLLPAGIEVAWSAAACGAEVATGSYLTGAEGPPVDPASLLDATWALDLDGATWVEPAGGEALFGQLFAGSLALGVQGWDEAGLDLLGGAVEEVEEDLVQQDPCVATFALDDVAFDNNPYVAAGPTTMSLEALGYTVPVQQVYLSGAFVDGGAALVEGRLQAEVDARDLADSLGASASELCTMLETYLGLSCVACSTDGEERCLGLVVEDIDGELIPGLALQPNPNPQECDDGTAGLRYSYR